jgi:hypothetical protein
MSEMHMKEDSILKVSFMSGLYTGDEPDATLSQSTLRRYVGLQTSKQSWLSGLRNSSQ